MNQAWLNGVRDELLYRARRCSRSEAPIGYSELARKFGMPEFGKDQPRFSEEHPLHDILRQLDIEDTKNEHTYLTCLVVHASGDKLRGNGFFTTIAEFRRLSNPIPKGKRLQYWASEMDRLFEFYQGVRRKTEQARDAENP